MKTFIILVIFALLMWFFMASAKDYDDSYVVWHGNGKFTVETY